MFGVVGSAQQPFPGCKLPVACTELNRIDRTKPANSINVALLSLNTTFAPSFRFLLQPLKRLTVFKYYSILLHYTQTPLLFRLVPEGQHLLMLPFVDGTSPTSSPQHS